MIKMNYIRQKDNSFGAVILFLFFILFLFVIQPDTRAETVLNGKVINATRDSSAVRNISVLLQSMKPGDNAPVDLDKTKTSANGDFNFVISNFDSLTSYFAMVEYQGARYYSGAAHGHSLQIVIFDSTQSLNNVSSFMHHILIDDLVSVVNIRETRIINNPGKYAITGGIHNTHIGEAVLEFMLPDNYKNFESISVNFGSNLSAHGTTVYTNAVLFPGNNQISYSYQVPWNKSSTDITLNLEQFTRSFDVFINSQDINIISNQLKDLGPFNIRNTQYKRYNAANLNSGTAVTFTIQRSVQEKQIPFLPITIAAIVLLIGAITGHYLNSRAKSQPVRNVHVDLEKRKDEIIEIIAKLDTEKKSVKNKNKRKELFEELQKIELSLMTEADSSKSQKK